MDKLNKIWCVFSIENNYDQPDNNLVAWFAEKPSLNRFAEFLGYPLDKTDDETILRIVKMWQGHQTQIKLGDVGYRLEEVPASKV